MATIHTINNWNVAAQARLIGQTVLLREHPLWFKVKIMNVKNAYGDTRLEVTPVDGSGLTWVSSSRVKLTDATLEALTTEVPQS